MSILDTVRAKYRTVGTPTDIGDKTPSVSNVSPSPRKSRYENTGDIASDTMRARDLAAVREAHRIATMVANGIVPAHYTSTTNCRTCGPVPAPTNFSSKVLGCPWCWAESSPRALEGKSERLLSEVGAL